MYRVIEIPNAKEFIFKEGLVQFKKVNFYYTEALDKKKLFKDLTFSILPNQHTAIVGPSGFGKSTIFNLIVKN